MTLSSSTLKKFLTSTGSLNMLFSPGNVSLIRYSLSSTIIVSLIFAPNVIIASEGILIWSDSFSMAGPIVKGPLAEIELSLGELSAYTIRFLELGSIDRTPLSKCAAPMNVEIIKSSRIIEMIIGKWILTNDLIKFPLGVFLNIVIDLTITLMM